MLKTDTFSKVIQNTPLISIDLIVKNNDGKILLGKRINKPAQDFWFVPGGRIYKNETLAKAFRRICNDELGVDFIIDEAKFYGSYEHFYENNVFNDKFSTHYIVLAHQIYLNTVAQVNDQHETYQWFGVNELLDQDDVHQYTKNYFKGKNT